MNIGGSPSASRLSSSTRQSIVLFTHPPHSLSHIISLGSALCVCGMKSEEIVLKAFTSKLEVCHFFIVEFTCSTLFIFFTQTDDTHICTHTHTAVKF